MTGRDRMVLIGIVVVAALGAAWMLVVSPERKQANQAERPSLRRQDATGER